MTVVKNLMVRAGADFSGLKKEMDNAQKQVAGFKSNLNKALQGIGLAIAAIGVTAAAALAPGIKEAMEFEAHMGTLNQTLGESTKGFVEWMNTVGKSLGMSKLQLAKYGNQYSLTLKGIAKDQDDLAKKTQETLQKVALIRSKTGMDITEISDRMRSAMNGEADGADELGVNVRVAAIEASKAYKMMANGQPFSELSVEMQKAIRWQHTMNSITENLGNTMANNTALKMSVFQASLQNLRLAMGQAWLPILNIALPALTKLANAITRVLSIFAQFMSVLFGYKVESSSGGFAQQTEAADSFGDSVAGVGDAYKKAGKEAKKAQGSLAGFDEINQLADKATASGGGESTPGSGGSGGATMPPIPNDAAGGVTQISGKIKEMALSVREFFSNIKDFFSGVGSFISQNKDIIIAALGGIAAGLGVYVIATYGAIAAQKIWNALVLVSSKLLNGLKAAWAFLTGPIGLIVLAVAALTAAFIYFYRTNDKFKGFVDSIFNKIKDAAIWLWQNALVPLGQWLGTVFVAAWDKVKTAGEWLWKNVLVPMGSFIGSSFKVIWEQLKKAVDVLWKDALVPLGEYMKVFWNQVLVPIGSVLKDVLAVAFKFVADTAKSLWTNVLVPLGNFFKETFKPTVEAISAVIKYLWENAIVPLGKYLGEVFLVVFKNIAKAVEYLWKEVFKPLVPYMQGALTKAFEGIGTTIDNLKTVFKGITQFIEGVFTKDWEKAWTGVKNIFKGIFDSLYGFVKAPLNLIIDAINQVVSGLNSLKVTIPDWVPGFGGKSWGINIPRIPKLARGGIVDSPTIAQIGEAGKEMVVPLENTSFVDKLASALGTAVMSAMQFNNNSGSGGDIVIQVDGTQLARVQRPYLAKETSRIGKSLISGT